MNKEALLSKIVNIDITSYLKQPEHDTVYHYTSPEGLVNIIQSMNLVGSDYNYLNDSREGRRSLVLLRNRCKDEIIYQSSEHMYERIRNLIDQINILADQGYYGYTISFSKSNDLLNMWKYYTKGSAIVGYSIEFSVNDLRRLRLKIDEDEYTEKDYPGMSKSHIGVFGGLIEYDKVSQISIIHKLIKEHLSCGKTNDENLYNKSDEVSIEFQNIIASILVRNIFQVGLFFKDSAFAEEEEYRLVCIPQYIGKGELLQNVGIPSRERFKIRNGLELVPYQVFEFDEMSRCPIRSVMLAPGMTEQRDKTAVERLLIPIFGRDENNKSKVRVIKSRISLRY